MLQIKHIEWNLYTPKRSDTSDYLLYKDPIINFVVYAPIFWWIEFDRDVSFFKIDATTICMDAWDVEEPILSLLADTIKNENHPRKLLQLLPLGTYATATISIRYSEAIEFCENYLMGEYSFHAYDRQIDNEREWTDFCETLLDIKGIRELTGGFE